MHIIKVMFGWNEFIRNNGPHESLLLVLEAFALDERFR
jgi:hypothetical protein